jgi:hypothetical protein
VVHKAPGTGVKAIKAALLDSDRRIFRQEIGPVEDQGTALAKAATRREERGVEDSFLQDHGPRILRALERSEIIKVNNLNFRHLHRDSKEDCLTSQETTEAEDHSTLHLALEHLLLTRSLTKVRTLGSDHREETQEEVTLSTLEEETTQGLAQLQAGFSLSIIKEEDQMQVGLKTLSQEEEDRVFQKKVSPRIWGREIFSTKDHRSKRADRDSTREVQTIMLLGKAPTLSSNKGMMPSSKDLQGEEILIKIGGKTLKVASVNKEGIDPEERLEEEVTAADLRDLIKEETSEEEAQKPPSPAASKRLKTQTWTKKTGLLQSPPI